MMVKVRLRLDMRIHFVLCLLGVVAGLRVNVQHRLGDISNKTADVGPILPPAPKGLILMSWNVDRLAAAFATPSHREFVQTALRGWVDHYHIDIVVLQEVESCSMLPNVGGIERSLWGMHPSFLPGFACVDAVAASLGQAVNGNVILYNTNRFEDMTSREGFVNRIRSFNYNAFATSRKDLDGKTLAERHAEECSQWYAYNGCNSHADMMKPTSIELLFKPGEWSKEFYSAFPGGLRVVDVHLFAYGNNKLTDSARLARRAFQMRSLIGLTDAWNADWMGQLGGHVPDAPATIFAGDFNTPFIGNTSGSFFKILEAANDYPIRLWCPANGGAQPKASNCPDPVLQTHRNGMFDNIVVDAPHGFVLRAKDAVVLDQREVPRQSDADLSDHIPILAYLEPVDKSMHDTWMDFLGN